jgi:hypothetical protein
MRGHQQRKTPTAINEKDLVEDEKAKTKNYCLYKNCLSTLQFDYYI